MFIPEIHTFLDEAVLPCLAYVGGTTVKDDVRLVGVISADGALEDVTLHGRFGVLNVAI